MQAPYTKQYDFLLSLGFKPTVFSHMGKDDALDKIEMRHVITFNSITLIIRNDEVTHYYYNGHKDSLVGLYEPDFEKFARKLSANGGLVDEIMNKPFDMNERFDDLEKEYMDSHNHFYRF